MHNAKFTPDLEEFRVDAGQRLWPGWNMAEN
jgi:hypothetical protein